MGFRTLNIFVLLLFLQVGEQHDCPTDDLEEMMDCLRDVSARPILRSNITCTVSKRINNTDRSIMFPELQINSLWKLTPHEHFICQSTIFVTCAIPKAHMKYSPAR